MLSGGLHSTGALFNMVDRGVRVVACHVEYQTALEAWPFEKHAVDKVEEYARQRWPKGAVEFRRSKVDLRNFRNCAIEKASSMAHIGSMLLKCDNRITAYARGRVPPDTLDTKRALHDVILRSTVSRRFGIVDMSEALSSHELYEAIPEDVRRIVWACDHPQGGFACGRCRGCKRIRDVENV